MQNDLDRRSFLSGGLKVVGSAALAGPLLGALGPGSAVAQAKPFAIPAAAKAKRGGTLTVGSLGGDQDTLDAHYSSTNIDQQRGQNLYDSLMSINEDAFTFSPALAESIEMNRDATVATIRLRKGVEFHNGKTLTAEDLVFSLRRILNPKNPGNAHSTLASINPNALKIVDKYTVRCILKNADSMFPSRWGNDQTAIVPVGFDPKKPVGTGPFMYKSFTPGSQSVFVRNPNYWMEGLPYLDQLTIIDFSDDTSRVNALRSGQIDALDGFDPSLLSQIQSGGSFKTLLAKSGYYQPITMRVDKAPFNDVRVRQAFRLMCGRSQMVEQAYGGYARVANDMPDPADPAYPRMPQRQQDIAKAKALLKAAGQENLSLTFTTAPEDVDLVNSAQVFAQQAAAAGVKIKIDNLTPSAYNVGFTKWPFTQGFWAAGLIGTGYATRFMPGGLFNDSHWDNAKTNSYYEQALRQTNETKRTELLGEILKYLYDNGPDIVHTFKYTVDAYSDQLAGFEAANSTGWSFGGWRYREVSFQ